ncbi:hypothetical protein GCM10009096_01180 [Parasphingorhabdus litoris]|uniref:Uncharacterized protein n=1 Tax=Parasphingorhabdus litoris TaxID=394733 RepID=A0ABP3JY13_9SPHN|nr:hypothetical protein [Parasphingorhabdus litoris]
MLNKFALTVAITGSMMASAAHAGISQNSYIAKGETLLLGDNHPKTISFDGQNRGDVAVEILLQNGTSRTPVRSVAPGESFNQTVRENQVMVLRNKSIDQRARVYWHVSGYSSTVNPRSD